MFRTLCALIISAIATTTTYAEETAPSPALPESAEVFRLKNGHVLTGNYDDERKKLTVIGTISVAMSVEPEDIKERRPATADEIKAAYPAPLTAEEKAARTQNARKVAIRDLTARQESLGQSISRWSKALGAEQETYDQVRAAADAARNDIAKQGEVIAQVTAQWDELQNARALYETEVSKFSRKLKAGTTDLELDTECAVWRTRLTAVDRRLAELKQRIDGGRAAQEALSARYNGLLKQMRDSQKKSADLTKKIERAGNEIDAAHDQATEYEAKLEDAAPRDEPATK
jgi:chromosome segregation ATPase